VIAQESSTALAERARLIAAMDGYLDVLVGRRGDQLRIAPTFRYTENTVTIPRGTGLWRTARGRDPGGHYFVDTGYGQVEFWGALDEMGAEAIYGVRLKVEGNLLSEVESVVVRGGSFFNPRVVVDEATGFHEIIPVGRRSTRAELIAVANAYFDAIELSDGTGLPVSGDCRRVVNGVVDSMEDLAQLEEGERHRALGVAEQMTARHYSYIEALRERRFPVVDVERGIVVCHVMFDHPGDLERPDGQLPFRSPNSMLVFEVFKVRAGLLREVWAIGTALPYGIPSGW
jgi:hypothetical protein